MKLGVKLKERAETSALLKKKLKNLEKMLQKTFILGTEMREYITDIFEDIFNEL